MASTSTRLPDGRWVVTVGISDNGGQTNSKTVTLPRPGLTVSPVLTPTICVCRAAWLRVLHPSPRYCILVRVQLHCLSLLTALLHCLSL